MRRLLSFALWMSVALSFGGCTFFAEAGGSAVVAGNEAGGTVSHVTTFTQAGALNMANSWCGQYGLVATETRIIFMLDSMDFACVGQRRM